MDRSKKAALPAGQELPQLAPHGRRLREGHDTSYGRAKFPAPPHPLNQYRARAASSVFGHGTNCGHDG